MGDSRRAKRLASEQGGPPPKRQRVAVPFAVEIQCLIDQHFKFEDDLNVPFILNKLFELLKSSSNILKDSQTTLAVLKILIDQHMETTTERGKVPELTRKTTQDGVSTHFQGERLGKSVTVRISRDGVYKRERFLYELILNALITCALTNKRELKDYGLVKTYDVIKNTENRIVQVTEDLRINLNEMIDKLTIINDVTLATIIKNFAEKLSRLQDEINFVHGNLTLENVVFDGSPWQHRDNVAEWQSFMIGFGDSCFSTKDGKLKLPPVHSLKIRDDNFVKVCQNTSYDLRLLLSQIVNHPQKSKFPSIRITLEGLFEKYGPDSKQSGFFTTLYDNVDKDFSPENIIRVMKIIDLRKFLFHEGPPPTLVAPAAAAAAAPEFAAPPRSEAPPRFATFSQAAAPPRSAELSEFAAPPPAAEAAALESSTAAAALDEVASQTEAPGPVAEREEKEPEKTFDPMSISGDRNSDDGEESDEESDVSFIDVPLDARLNAEMQAIREFLSKKGIVDESKVRTIFLDESLQDLVAESLHSDDGEESDEEFDLSSIDVPLDQNLEKELHALIEEEGEGEAARSRAFHRFLRNESPPSSPRRREQPNVRKRRARPRRRSRSREDKRPTVRERILARGKDRRTREKKGGKLLESSGSDSSHSDSSHSEYRNDLCLDCLMQSENACALCGQAYMS
jgi:hypothetical protein